MAQASGGPKIDCAAVLGIVEPVDISIGAGRADADAAKNAGDRAWKRYDTLSSKDVATHDVSQVYVT